MQAIVWASKESLRRFSASLFAICQFIRRLKDGDCPLRVKPDVQGYLPWMKIAYCGEVKVTHCRDWCLEKDLIKKFIDRYGRMIYFWASRIEAGPKGDPEYQPPASMPRR